MVRVVHKGQSEISMDYVNLPDASARSGSGKENEVNTVAPGKTEILQLLYLTMANVDTKYKN